ncbi:cytochrome c3 family protein [Neobacillus sp. LXY-4]|uniref:cytochrome c3 family protein n=1 Tax=Neobacillus sp. LXY-4 TaxID=3379826 RepID=UPI003EDFF887
MITLDKRPWKSLQNKSFILFILITVLFGIYAPTTQQGLKMITVKAATHTLSSLTQSGVQISLNWTADPNATGYHVYRTTNQGMIRLTGTTPLPANILTFNDSNNIKDGVLYQYEVSAIVNGVEVFSNAQAIYSQTPPIKSSLPISATPGSNYVDLAFSPSLSSDVAYYEIFRNGALVGSTANLLYRDLGINAATYYTYSVKAVDQDGLKSDFYTQIAVTTLAPPEGQAMQNVTLLTENFAGQWVENPDSAALTLSDKALWRVELKNQTRTEVAAELSSSYPFSIRTSPNEAEVSFSWTKAWLSNSSRNDGTIELIMEAKPLIGGTWTEKWSDRQSVVISGNSTVKIGNVPGQYLIRFRAVLKNIRNHTTLEATVDNVVIKQLVPNVVPVPPTSIKGQAVSSNLINLSWTASSDSDIVGYKIYRKTDAEPNYPSLPIATKNATNYVDPTVQKGQSYRYKIVAVDDRNLESQGIETAAIKTPETTINKDVTPPEQLRDLKLSQVGAASAELTWLPSSSSDLKGYLLLRSTNGVDYSIVKNMTTLTTIDKLLTANTEYFYRIIGVDSAGNPSAPSNLLKIKTKQADTEPPSAPQNFSVDFTGETYVKFQWSAATDNDRVDRYIIEQFENDWVQKGVFYPPATTGTIQGLLPGTSYQFRIKAVDTSNNASIITSLVNPAAAKTIVDTSPPKMTFTRPAKGSKAVGTKEAIIIRFDDVINKETVNATTFKVIYNPPTAALAYVPGETIDGTYQFNSETNPTEVQFVPAESLQPETTYQVMVTDVENQSGTSIEGVTYTFTTGTTEFNQPHGDYTETTAFCSSCHNTHTSERPRLLNDTPENVCFSCHNGMGSSFNVKTQLFNENNVKGSLHPVLENTPSKEENIQQTCTSCHNPHDGGKDLDTGLSNHLPRLLTPFNKGDMTANPPILPTQASQGNAVCWTCHGNEGGTQLSFGYLSGGKIINPPYSGSAYDYRTDHQSYFPTNKGHSSEKMDSKKGQADANSGTNIKCTACHEKHGSDVKPLLRNNIVNNVPDGNIVNGKEFCYQCHRDQLDLANADNSNAATKSYDGQVINEDRGHSQFDCQVCHNPHGSPYPNYLRLNYNVDTSVQKPFEVKDAELCFDCHDQAKLVSKGAALSGNQAEGSLHSSHLSTSGQSQCKDCHRPHGTIESENGDKTKLSHRIGFPSSQVGSTASGAKLYNRDATAANSIQGGSGSCSLSCHGKEHNGSNYDGSFRNGSDITNFNLNNAYMLKDNWKTTSILLNTRPDGTGLGVYDFGDYKIDYRNGVDASGSKTHFRDGDTNGNIKGDGYIRK